MKLSDVKSKIDSYFENIDAHELYELSISKYGFIDCNSYTVIFEKIDVFYLREKQFNFDDKIDICKNDSFLLAA